nr:uncharacterized protein LOC117224316 isoform X1 [Megalopta genalis]XP_033333023.1 uncharacterized protein LOC117224316 isoform X1 [Megalopta genalis]
MKLGDNMTMEAYNIWGDVPPRKCRPPKIGDIPKHTAVDEGSPGSVSRTLPAPQDPRDPLDASLDAPRNIVFPLDSGERFSGIRRFDLRRPDAAFQYSEKAVGPLTFEVRDSSADPAISKKLARDSPDSLKPKLRASERSSDADGKVTIKLPREGSKAGTRDQGDSSGSSSSPEDATDREIVEVRKDSALFLEEPEGLPTLREILKSRGPRVIRPRRESSGYASNLGTFDEERRSSTADALQDLSLFVKDRRRSSAGPKRLNSKLLVGRAGDSLTEEADALLDRMPTTELHRKLSSAGLDMPNIEEAKELRDEPAPKDTPSTLCSLLERVGVEEARCPPERGPDPRVPPKSDTETLQASKGCVTPEYRDPFVGGSVGSIDPATTCPTNPAPQNPIVCLEIPSSDRDMAAGTGLTRDRTGLSIDIEKLRIDGTSPAAAKDEESKNLPRTVKVYQLLSTQSEDRTDRELYLADRRISLQISKHDDPQQSILLTDESKDDSSAQPGSTLTLSTSVSSDMNTGLFADITDDSIAKKGSGPLLGEPATGQRFLGDAGITVRPIYPYCPYSPYGSPQGSPRNRRRPLRESRRVSIDNRQGALQLNQYKLLDNIGQGSYGIVKLAYNEEDDTHYAMKILSKKKLMKKAGIFGRMAPGRKGAADPLAKVYREIALLKKLDHPNVVKLVEVLDDPDEDNLYLVFELVQRGEILQIPTEKPLDEETARKHFRDVVMGVEYLHYQRIVHRDIKPSNLLVDSDDRIKIADLGVSAELRASGELLSGPAGTPAFAAPETTTPGAHYSGTLCDVWSMGVTLYSLVTGRVPWYGSGSIIGVQAAVRTEPLRFPDEPILSDDLRELISRMLEKNPAERVTLSAIKEHPWLTNRSAEPLPSEADNCRLPVTVTDEEVREGSVVTRIPKLDTLILIKTMLKQHSFQNPFLPRKSGKTACSDAAVGSLEISSSPRTEEPLLPRKPARNAKSERFQRTGRSNSAPDSYDWQTNGRCPSTALCHRSQKRPVRNPRRTDGDITDDSDISTGSRELAIEPAADEKGARSSEPRCSFRRSSPKTLTIFQTRKRPKSLRRRAAAAMNSP